MKISRSLIMILLLIAFGVFVFGTNVYAQAQPPKEGQDPFYKLNGYRHGANFFPENNLVETTPLVWGEMDFKHYHTYEEVVYWMERWAKEYPNLIDLYVGGVSYEGRDIMQITLTNKSTGPDTDKPAMAIDGNRHAGEVTAAESALWMLWYMLTNYGKEQNITDLVDNFAFYFRPKNNPDGSSLYLHTAQTLRSTTRPYDSDGDGLLDEDPAEDLDGDGFIRQMRVTRPKGQGRMITDPRDPKGRLMMSAPEGEGIYDVMSEGWDNDGDGRVNEDGIGGLDLHRNYPENWRPMSGRDATGRGFTQGGAGEYPLSEPETRSLVVFLLEHPNVSVMNTMDTTVPMHLRPPSTSASDERMYPEDLALYKHFDEKGMEISGYSRAGDVYQDYGRGRPLFGHSPDFGYWYYGSIWYGDELWNGGRVTDYDNDGQANTDLDKLLFNDNELEKSRFQEWTPAMHPVHGEVEVGGWNPKFWRQNPPPDILEIWIKKEAFFNLMLAESLPNVVINEPTVRSEGNGEYTVEVDIENTGFIPTALLQAQLVKIVRPDMVYLDFPEGMVARGGARGGRGGGGMGGGRGGQMQVQQQQRPASPVQILEPSGGSVDIDRITGKGKKSVSFRIKLNNITSVTATIRYSSTRGGVKTKEITIGSDK
ncbi:M14 family metallopeptidase [candidate division KSB1 bacterium]